MRPWRTKEQLTELEPKLLKLLGFANETTYNNYKLTYNDPYCNDAPATMSYRLAK